MKIHFTRMLWDEDAKAMRAHQFTLTVDVTKLKPITLNKAHRNKSHKSRALNGAIIIEHTGALT
jgi:hypothetical protein